ncbi:MAG: efflux RND transporter periplasmic adaptor subunit [Planctomycetales bacterium]|nr:efflux RND transporter periplasmic adaptor subunit [Planctomycetales bacterium]MCA9232969.1 efflux RND transporter periplasmic adaptor subunit [Planctomycetales bacterium]
MATVLSANILDPKPASVVATGDTTTVGQTTGHVVSLGADSINCWRITRENGTSRFYSWGDPSDRVIQAAFDLANRALNFGENKTCLLSLPTPHLIIAQLIPSQDRRECVTVSFPCELTELCEDASSDRLQAVELLARSFHEPDDLHEQQYSPSGPVSRQGSDRASTNEPHEEPEFLSWVALTQQISGKLNLELKRHLGLTKIYLGGLICTILLGLMPFPHRIGCGVVCEPVVRRYVAVPFDARLANSDVFAGQQVTKGQRLATLDGGELLTQLAGLRAQSAQAEQRLLAALHQGDHSKAELERLESEQLAHEIELLESRQRQLDICSPIDGIVITGDLERAQGTPLTTGEILFEIASLERFVAEIAIDEADIGHVEESMEVSVSLDSAPGNIDASKISRIHLRNEIRKNESVYIAESSLENTDNKLRPGMNGSATIHAGYRPLGWILFHRPIEVVRHWIGW